MRENSIDVKPWEQDAGFCFESVAEEHRVGDNQAGVVHEQIDTSI